MIILENGTTAHPAVWDDWMKSVHRLLNKEICIDYSVTENLVRTEEYDGTSAFCCVAKAARSFVLGNITWLHLLLKRERYSRIILASVTTFESLVAKNPADANALFWLRYVYWIV